MTEEFRPTLEVPDAWIQTLEPGADVSLSRAIVLSYGPKVLGSLAEQGVSLQDVEQSLSLGLSLQRRPGDGGEYYVLKGGDLEVFAKQDLGRRSGRPLAIVTRVSRAAQNEAKRLRLVPLPARFEPLHQEVGCDLRAVWARCFLSTPLRKHKDALEDRLRSLTRPLLRLLDLLEAHAQRCQHRWEGAVESFVAESEEIQARAAVRFPEPRLALPGLKWQLEVGSARCRVDVVEQSSDRVTVEFQEPTVPALAPGEAVVLATVNRQAYGAHRKAIHRLLDRDVRADWAELATLVADPSALPELGDEVREELYPELDLSQSIAVRRALAATGSFFIHGPPGTGKTRVIARLVRELVDDEQRVLILSTTHVAVDEVLNRVGDLPGVHAVRVTWDTSRVDDNARRFTYEAVRDTRVRKLVHACTEARSLYDAELSALVGRTDPTAEEKRRKLQALTRLADAWEQTVTDPEGRRTLTKEIGDELLAHSNAVFATTVGIASRAFVDLGSFDVAIFDESSRMTVPEFLIGATRARRSILVGDEHQLPPFIDRDVSVLLTALAGCAAFERGEAASVEEAAAQALGRVDEPGLAPTTAAQIARLAVDIHASRAWERIYAPSYLRLEEALDRTRDAAAETPRTFAVRVLGESVFDVTVARCPESRRARLVTQRRMIEPIASLVSGPIYPKHHYASASPEVLRGLGVEPFVIDEFREPIVFLDTTAYGDKARETRVDTGCVNTLEAGWILGVCRLMDGQLARSKGKPDLSVSILSFYKDQAEMLRSQLRDLRLPSLRFRLVESVDRVQGQEADVVFLSFCRAHTGRKALRPEFGAWLQDLRRLNVALTRARRGLFLVGHASTLRRLCGSERVVAFYEHLFSRFDSRTPGHRLVSDFRPPRRR